MPYCPNCGTPVNQTDRFCANCGTALQPVTAPTPVTGTAPVTVTASDSSARSDYRIVLISRGTCGRAVAIDMLSDLLGYSDPDAARIIDNAPMEVALGLTAIQAQYISQAITEYGMEVAIFNDDGYVDMGSKATTSVYDNDGSFLSAVAGVLAGLTLSNRVSSYHRWTRPAPVLFRPAYRRPRPLPTYHRRRPAPRPIPVVHHAPPARPTPPVRPAPVPTPAPPRSVAASRPGATVPPRPAPHPGAAPQRPAPRPGAAPQRPVPHPGAAPQRPTPGGPVNPLDPNRRPGGAGRGR